MSGYGTALLGLARQARHGGVRPGAAGYGTARLGMAGKVRQGSVGEVRQGVAVTARPGKVW